jgi:hypothetical protein
MLAEAFSTVHEIIGLGRGTMRQPLCQMCDYVSRLDSRLRNLTGGVQVGQCHVRAAREQVKAC